MIIPRALDVVARVSLVIQLADADGDGGTRQGSNVVFRARFLARPKQPAALSAGHGWHALALVSANAKHGTFAPFGNGQAGRKVVPRHRDHHYLCLKGHLGHVRQKTMG